MTNSSATFSTTTPLVLLPPSEGKAEDRPPTQRDAGWDPSDGSFGRLSPRRSELAALLAESGGGDEKLLGVKGDHLARAQSANRTLFGAPTMPAWQRYTGVVWNHLEPASLPAAARRRIVVFSGLLGAVRADDPVPDYRLKMGSNPGVGKLSTWWRNDLSTAVNAAARRKVVIDLLPQEHRAAWEPDDQVEGVTVSFLDRSGKPGGHFAKAAKGAFAKALLTSGLDALDTWSDERFELVVTPL